MQAVSIIRSGEPMQLGSDTVVEAYMTAHFLTVKVKINDSKKEYNFLVDTGSLTVIDKNVVRELNLNDFVQIKTNDSAGNSKNVSFVELDQINVGDVVVGGCGVGVIDLGKFGKDIDGILGSNFLQYFTVQIDYQKTRLVFLAGKYSQASTDKTKKIPIYKNMKFGFAPMGTCKINTVTAIDCMIDTGHPEIASIPVSLIRDLPRFQEKVFVVESTGGMTGGIFGADEKSYVTRVDKLQIGSLEVQDIPVLSNRFSDEIMTLGYALLSNYLVTIDFPNSEIYLESFPESKLEKTYKSFGLSFAKENSGIFVKGVWHNSPADEMGLSVGDKVIEINSKKLDDISLLGIIDIIKNKNEIDLLCLDSKTKIKTRTTLIKNDLLPVF